MNKSGQGGIADTLTQNVYGLLTKTYTKFGGRAYKCLQTNFDEQQNRIEIMALFKAMVRTPRKDGFYQVLQILDPSVLLLL